MKARWKLIGLAVAVLFAAGVYLKNRKSAPAEVRRAAAETGDLVVSIQATGVVEPQNRVEIKPPIAGRAEEILVKEGEPVKKGQIVAWMSSSERAALIDAARARGQAELKHWEQLYKPAPLVAPLDGVVIARNFEPGQTLTAQDAVLVMSNRLVVKAQVDETDIGQVRIGQSAAISLDAYPRDAIAGKVDHIAFEAKTVNNVTIYEVEVAPEKVNDLMRSGMTANVTFEVDRATGAVMVPAEAVQMGESGAFVLLPSANGKPERRKVEIGLTNGRETQIVSGLAAGDAVLIKSVRFDAEKKEGGQNPFSPWSRRRSGSGGGGGGRR